jgi:hypothetical protein
MFRSILTAAAVIASTVPALAAAQTVDELVARNLAARGGESAWRAVKSLKISGTMGLGRGMFVPYVMEQQRPDKMRFEFVFNGQTAVQTMDGKRGWKLAPFLGRTDPEPMTEAELRESADMASIDGLLFDYAAHGHKLELLGRSKVDGKDAFKLKVTLPAGAVRWVYLDADSGLELKMEAKRKRGKREWLVETYSRDWKETAGLLIPHRQETRAEGRKKSHLFFVADVQVNPRLEQARFDKPASVAPKTAAVQPSTAAGGKRGK